MGARDPAGRWGHRVRATDTDGVRVLGGQGLSVEEVRRADSLKGSGGGKEPLKGAYAGPAQREGGHRPAGGRRRATAMSGCSASNASRSASTSNLFAA